ncbi:MAG: cyd operon YbgE family protein [Nitrosomonadales bacterium]|nr:cyd operon YbgE family protein [Nitrosomonadales bacterium]
MSHNENSPLYARSPRMVSLLLALGVSGTILTYPTALGHAEHWLLMLVMWGTSAGFVHGVGFKPEHRLWRILLGPWAAWTLLAIGLAELSRG